MGISLRGAKRGALFLPLLLAACSGNKDEARPNPPVPVTVAVAARKSVPLRIEAIGNVEAYNSVSVKAQVNGQVARVHFREGDDVRRGELLFTIDPRPFEAALRKAEGELARDQAQARFAREQVKRYGDLLKDGIVTQDQYDQLKANADAYDAAIAADRAAVDSARVQLGYCYIHSPIDGRTGNLAVKAGNLVKANDLPVLVTINQVNPIYVTFSVPEKVLPEIKIYSSKERLKVEASLPNAPSPPETGTVTFIDNAVDTATGMIRLKGTFANGERRLWPGQFVNVAVTLTTIPEAVTIPTRAIQTGQQGDFVFVVGKEERVEIRAVKTTLAQGEESVIGSGVEEGETVVTDGQLRLVPGAKVEIKGKGPAAPPKPGG